MMQSFEAKIVNYLMENDIIMEEDLELYSYGLKQLFYLGINVITAIMIGMLLGMIWQSVLFSLAYIPLRQYAGGYHASNSVRCYILSLILIYVALLTVKHAAVDLTIVLCVIVISNIIIWIKAPVESKNKRLNDKEKKAFGKYARGIAVIESSVSLAILNVSVIAAKCVLISVALSAILVMFSDKVNEKKIIIFK